MRKCTQYVTEDALGFLGGGLALLCIVSIFMGWLLFWCVDDSLHLPVWL